MSVVWRNPRQTDVVLIAAGCSGRIRASASVTNTADAQHAGRPAKSLRKQNGFGVSKIGSTLAGALTYIEFANGGA